MNKAKITGSNGNILIANGSNVTEIGINSNQVSNADILIVPNVIPEGLEGEIYD